MDWLAAGVLQASSEDGTYWKVKFTAPKKRSAGYDVMAALFVSDVVSDVKADENAGRHFGHDFVAVLLFTQPTTNGTDGFLSSFTIGVIPKISPADLHLASG